MFNITPPWKNLERGNGLVYTIDIEDNGSLIARAELLHINRPVPFAYLFFLKVEPTNRSQGYGSRLLQEFNEYLEIHSRYGLLRNIIPAGHPAHLIYQKHGWLPIKNQATWYII